MLEQRFDDADQRLKELNGKLIENAQGLAHATGLYRILGRRPIVPLEGEEGFDLTDFDISEELPWEKVLDNLSNIGSERRRLREEAIPEHQRQGPIIEAQVATTQREKEKVLEEITAKLSVSREFVCKKIRTGDLFKEDLAFVDGVYDKYGLGLPEPGSIPTPNLDEFFKLVKNPKPYSVFINSSQAEYLVTCLNSNMQSNNGILDSDIGGAVFGYSFEQMVTPQIRPLLMGIAKESGVQTFFILPPKDTFDLIKAANSKKRILEYSSGLRKGIEGTRVPDALIFVPKSGQLYLSGVCEITAANLECEGNERKQSQIDHYEARHDGVYEQMAKIFEEYNRNMSVGDIGAVLGRHESLVGKKVNVFNPDEGFKTWYLIPFEGRIINGIPEDRFLKVNVGFKDLRNFVNALIEDYYTEYSLLGEVSPTAFRRP